MYIHDEWCEMRLGGSSECNCYVGVIRGLEARIEALERERDHYRGNVDRWAEEVAARDTRIEELEKDPWWRRISRGDIAAELSATFDIGLDVAVRIADWILSTQKGGQ